MISFELLAGDNKFIDVGSAMVYVECSVRTAQSDPILARIPNPADAAAVPIVNSKVKTSSSQWDRTHHFQQCQGFPEWKTD